MRDKAMSCEICEIIERQGLHASAHDWWFCSDAGTHRRCRTALHRLKQHWLRLVVLERRRVRNSAPYAISRELKILSYSVAAQLGTHLR
jgi:hypothetical protein